MLRTTLQKTLHQSTVRYTQVSGSVFNGGMKRTFGASVNPANIKTPFSQLNAWGKSKRIVGNYFKFNLVSMVLSGSVCFSAYNYNKYFQE